MFQFPLEAQALQKILPHRYPFLLVDRVEKMILGAKSPAGDKIIGYKAVAQNEPYFQGHFPGNPVMPGVLILEAFAQTASVGIFYHVKKPSHLFNTYFAGIDEAKFRHPVFPGSLLRLEVEFLKVSTKKFWFAHGQAFVIQGGKEELAVKAKLVFAIIPKEKKDS